VIARWLTTSSWSPVVSVRGSVVWATVVGFVLQLLVPPVLAMYGFQNAAIWSLMPGLYPIIWLTGGWFEALTPLGYLLMLSINTLVYGYPFSILFRGLRNRRRLS
jgi:hypothetical protein